MSKSGEQRTHQVEVEPSPLGWALSTLARQWRTRVQSAAGDLPHASRGYQVLREVVDNPPRSQAELAARLGIDRTVMTYLIDDCVAAGLLQREPDPADRRARRIVASEAGLKRLDELHAAVADAEDELLAGIEPTERAAFLKLLERVASPLIHDEQRCAEAATNMTD